MQKFWVFFFMFWAAAAVLAFAVAPEMNWWFPKDGHAYSTIGPQIDDLFYLILVIVAIAFIGTQIGLGYVLWTGVRNRESDRRALFSHGSHVLEVIWTIVPAGILLFIALYQMDVWAMYRIKSNFPAKAEPVAEVTARQFEWRIRYPAPGKTLELKPRPDDLYTVNELHVPTGRPVVINLRTDDVQHAFFLPELRIKQDAVPNLTIPVWFEATKNGDFELLCAELCGWGHYKMKAVLQARPAEEFDAWKLQLQKDQTFDGVTGAPAREE